MAEEQNAFAFGDVVEAITRKMIRRHPHVFADKDGNIAAAGVKSAWERIKAEEKAERAARRPPEETAHKSLLSGVKAGPAGADARDGIAAQGVHRRLRLERSPRGAAARSARRPTRSKPRWTTATPTNSPRKPAISCSRWSTWRAMSAPIPKPRCAAPTPSSSAALPISSARWRPRAARSKTPRSTRWTRCGTRRRARSRPSGGQRSPGTRHPLSWTTIHATCGTASKRTTTMSRLVSSTRTVMSNRPS